MSQPFDNTITLGKYQGARPQELSPQERQESLEHCSRIRARARRTSERNAPAPAPTNGGTQ